MELFLGASLFNLHITKTKSWEEANEPLEKLRSYPFLNQEGDGNSLDALKCSFNAYW
jgi:hypothetical protein